jgi:hypothetical protein
MGSPAFRCSSVHFSARARPACTFWHTLQALFLRAAEWEGTAGGPPVLPPRRRAHEQSSRQMARNRNLASHYPARTFVAAEARLLGRQKGRGKKSQAFSQWEMGRATAAVSSERRPPTDYFSFSRAGLCLGRPRRNDRESPSGKRIAMQAVIRSSVVHLEAIWHRAN